MHQGDEKSIFIHVIINSDQVVFAFYRRAVITIFGRAAFFDPQFKIKLINPFGYDGDRFIGNVLIKNRLISFELIHGANLRSGFVGELTIYQLVKGCGRRMNSPFEPETMDSLSKGEF